MRRLIRWAAWLYPASWRARYGAEFEALLDDVKPGGRNFWDVLQGAFAMQMTMWNFGKITAICGLAGLIVAGALAFWMPAQYVSIAVMRISPVNVATLQHIENMQHQILSRTSLAQIITRPDFDLYKTDRGKRPLEDIVQDMRSRSIRIRRVGADTFEIDYQYPNKYKAQAVVRALVAKFVEQNLTAPADPHTLELLDPASLPEKPISPRWPQMLLWGMAGGVVFGLVTALVATRPARRTMQIVGSGIAGFVVAAALSFLVPNQYISTAVLRPVLDVPPPDQLIDSDLLAKVVASPRNNQSGSRVVESVEDLRKRLTIRRLPEASAFTISFQSTDRFGAESVLREIVSQAIQKQEVPPQVGRPASGLQILDPASTPEGPSSPNRLTMALIGLVAGMILGGWFLRTRVTPVPTP